MRQLPLGIALILAVLATAPVAEAQPPAKISRIGVLGGTSPEVSAILRAFFQGLRELGYVEGQNVVIEGRYYGDRVDRLPALAAELVRLPVDVIVTGAVPAPEAAKGATSAIPIVMAAPHPDPVRSGLVASLARPGGNVTGLSGVGFEFRGKQLLLLREALPSLGHVAVLSDPTNPFHPREVKELATWTGSSRAPGRVTSRSSSRRSSSAWSIPRRPGRSA
jgi:putative ABC transport system substrate-binding protein